MRTILLVPVHDESARLAGLLRRLEGAGDGFLLVDDGSRDGSGEILADWVAERPEAEVLCLPRNQGKSAAVARGLLHLAGRVAEGDLAGSDIVVLLDADEQHPPEAARALGRALVERGLDMLVACRDLSCYPAFKILGNRLLTLQARLLTEVRWRDTQCGMRALRAAGAEEAAGVLQAGGYACEQEMCVALPLRGWRTANDHPLPLGHGRSNSTLRDAFHIFAAGLRAWSRHRRVRSLRAEEPVPTLP